VLVPESAPDDAREIAARIQVLERRAPDLRQAAARVGGVTGTLPESESFLFGPDVLDAAAIMRRHDPASFLVACARISDRCGRPVANLFHEHVTRRALHDDLAHGPARLWLEDTAPATGTDYLVKGVLGRGRTAVVVGPPGGGKTFFVMDLVGHVAATLPWRGRRTRLALIVYVAAEAGPSIGARAYAWRMRHISEVREHRVPFLIVPRTFNLLEHGQVDALIALVEDAANELGIDPGQVVFDTLSRTIPGADENSSEVMGAVVGAGDRIREQLGAGSLFVHHTPKSNAQTPRGHGALLAAADTAISVVDRVAALEKARDGISGERFPFDLEVVDLGHDEDGDALSTCIVKALEPGPETPHKSRLTDAERIALDALREAIEERGENLPASSVIPTGRRGVRADAWRAAFKRRYGEAGPRSDEAASKAFQRAREGLIADRIVGSQQPWLWIW
jgi:putative DNA primase/helicase